MSPVDDVDQLIEQWQLAAGEFVKGNPEPVKKLWSRREDVTLANPYGPPVRGWEQVAKTIEHAPSLLATLGTVRRHPAGREKEEHR